MFKNRHVRARQSQVQIRHFGLILDLSIAKQVLYMVKIL